MEKRANRKLSETRLRLAEKKKKNRWGPLQGPREKTAGGKLKPKMMNTLTGGNLGRPGGMGSGLSQGGGVGAAD